MITILLFVVGMTSTVLFCTSDVDANAYSLARKSQHRTGNIFMMGALEKDNPGNYQKSEVLRLN